MKKQWMAMALILCLILPLAVSGQNAGLTEEQLKALPQGPASLTLSSTAAAVGDVFYALGSDHAMYRWQTGSEQAERMVQLAVPPSLSLVHSYDELQAGDKAQMDEVVTHLIAGEDTLWGLSLYSGRVGAIDETGIHWKDAVLADEDLLSRQRGGGGVWVNGFVQQGILYLKDDARLLRMNLSDGAFSELALKRGVMGLSPYLPGRALATGYELSAQKPVGYNSDMMVMDLNTGELTPYPGQLPAFEIDPDMGADLGSVCYSAQEDTVYLVAHGNDMPESGMLCRSKAGGGFEKLAILPDMYVYAQLFALPDERVAVYDSANGVMVFSVPELVRNRDTALRIRGGYGGHDTLRDYMRQHPGTTVLNQNVLVGEGDIMNLLTGAGDTDLYALYANTLYRAMVQKGYAADLSDITDLQEAMQGMLPGLKDLLHDDQGRLRGWPAGSILLGVWNYDSDVWKNSFGDAPYPATMVELLDTLLKWEVEHAPQQDGVNVYFHDVYSLLAEIVRQYVLDYEQPGEPLKFDTPHFREVVSAFVRLNKAVDKDRMRQNDEGEVGAASLLAGGGTSTHTVTMFTSDLMNTMLLPPPRFEADKPAHIRASADVLVLNAHSDNQAQAADFVRFAANRGPDSVMGRQAMYPDQDTPLEHPDYAVRSQALTVREDALRAGMEAAEGTDRQAYEEQLNHLNLEREALEKQRWWVTQEGIERYRAWIPLMRFTNASLYLSQNDSNPFDAAMVALCQRLAEGALTEEGFISALNDVARKIYMENK